MLFWYSLNYTLDLKLGASTKESILNLNCKSTVQCPLRRSLYILEKKKWSEKDPVRRRDIRDNTPTTCLKQLHRRRQMAGGFKLPVYNIYNPPILLQHRLNLFKLILSGSKNFINLYELLFIQIKNTPICWDPKICWLIEVISYEL